MVKEQKELLYNVNRIRGQMAEHGDNAEKLANALAITSAGLYKKLGGESLFNANELYIIATRYNKPVDFFYKK